MLSFVCTVTTESTQAKLETSRWHGGTSAKCSLHGLSRQSFCSPNLTYWVEYFLLLRHSTICGTDEAQLGISWIDVTKHQPTGKQNLATLIKLLRTGALVKWLWKETHVPKVMGSNPGAVYWMDMTFFHIDLL